ncbi:MAG: MJ0042-type zinc finger domain-containing protein, partial [Verrucomicrobiales bacterium]
MQIRCPACGQRFKVGSDLRDRMVECGSCEHRFRIDDETILRTKKFYPGERRDPRLDGFARVPHAPSVLPNVQTIRYAEEPAHESFEPPTPQRTMAAVVGCIGMVMAGLLLTLGASRTGALDGFELPSRLALAGFASVLGSVMLVYGNPRARRKA